MAEQVARAEMRAQRAPAGERRQITALLYDIVNSTGLLHQLDPEDFGRVQRIIHAEAAAAIRRNGGYFDRILGDAGCAFFGYPEPAEDAAECAVAAALELVERCKSAGSRLNIGQPVRVRAGVATGLVVLSSGEGGGLPATDEIVGIAPALAARIQSEAEPDSVAVADATYRITWPAFNFEPLGFRSLKGFGEPQELWRPIRKRASEDRFSKLRRPETPLIAREDELDLCRRRWAQAREGRGQTLFVVGEPGIGKSRLVTALRHEVAAMGNDARLLQCQPRGNTRPFHPLLDLLRREISGSIDETAKPDPEVVRGYLQRVAPESRDETAALISFLLMDVSEQRTSDSDFRELLSSELKQRIIAAALDLLRAWSRARPQLLILEDIHWADTMTMTLLARVVHEAGHLPLLVVVTTRDAIPAGLSGAKIKALSLSRLGVAAVSRMVEAIWAPLAPPRSLPAFVHDRSEGVPLFIEELTRLLKDRFGGSSTGVPDWERALHDEGVASLRDFISARLAGLGEARRIAQIASAIGREFSRDLLACIVEEEISPAVLEACLGRLIDAGLVRRRNADHGLVFRFRHVLIQEAAYESLLKSARRELHDRIVRAVLEGSVAGLPDDVMAWHCEQAGRSLHAAKFAVAAAETCAFRSAMHEAERLLVMAEKHLSKCGQGPHVDELMLQLCVIRGPVAMALFGKSSPEACATYEKGVAICNSNNLLDREKWFSLYWGWWFTAPDFGTQNVRSQTLVRDSARITDPEVKLQSLHCGWATHFHAGNHGDCLDCIERGLALYDPDRAIASRTRFGGHDAKVCALGERGLSQWLLGDSEAAIRSLDAALHWAEEIGHVGSLCHALDCAIVVQLLQSSVAEVADLACRMREVADAHDLPGLKAKSRIFGGWAHASTGSLAEGLRELEEGLRIQRAIGSEEDLPIHIAMWAELLGRAGNPEAGIQALDSAIRHAEETGNVVWISELYRRRALLHPALGDSLLSGLDDLRRALAEAERQGAIAVATRVRADLDRFGVEPPLDR